MQHQELKAKVMELTTGHVQTRALAAIGAAFGIEYEVPTHQMRNLAMNLFMWSEQADPVYLKGFGLEEKGDVQMRDELMALYTWLKERLGPLGQMEDACRDAG